MNYFQIAILAVVQGLAELLPVSSSAHVITAEKLMGLDPASPEMTLLLVALHTGTMMAVLLYFWKDWRENYFTSRSQAVDFLKQVILATAATGAVGILLLKLIEKVILRDVPKAEVEMLFGNFTLISIALASAGLLILFSSAREGRQPPKTRWGAFESVWIGFVQGLCLPFRGFSRSGATISTGLILGLSKAKAEQFSFALALVLTPPVLAREIHRLLKAQSATGGGAVDLSRLFFPSLLGMVLSFLAGFLALRILSNWLEKGRWKFFGYYCLAASAGIWIFIR